VSSELLIWWVVLCVTTVVNVSAWGVSAWLLARRRLQWPAEVYRTRRLMLWLAAVYMLGCAYRSVLPMIELPRICLFDLWISRSVISRSIATVAELAFALECALLLREAGGAFSSRFTSLVSRVVIPAIVLAELFCWFAVLSTSYLAHALENATWTLTAVLAVAAFASLWPRAAKQERRFLAAATVSGTGYVLFMVVYDVPMYLSRWQASLAAGGELRPLLEGMSASLQRCVVEHDWAVWRDDAIWLTGYFTLAVWISIAMAHAPLLRPAMPGRAIGR